MASGPAHYTEAESLLEQADEWLNGEDAAGCFELVHTRRAEDLAAAQVHATLALASATALSENGSMPGADFDAWAKVASANPTPPSQLTVWWVDDGHENPGKPPLFIHAAAARDFAIKRFENDNPFTDTAGVVDWLVQPEDGDSSEDVELVVLGRRTGIIVRPIQPKAVVGA